MTPGWLLVILAFLATALFVWAIHWAGGDER